MTIIWYMVPDTWSTTNRIFFSLDHFFPFDPNTTKIKILKKWKNCVEIISFYTCVPQMMIIWCMVPETYSTTGRFFLSIWALSCRFSPLTTRKIKILKKWNNYLEILSYDAWFLRYEARQTELFIMSFYSTNSPKNQN